MTYGTNFILEYFVKTDPQKYKKELSIDGRLKFINGFY